MRRALVNMHGALAGHLMEEKRGRQYHFQVAGGATGGPSL